MKGIDLKVHPGEFVSIVGPTGCGKSTLLNAAAGLLAPSAGSVGIFGNVIRVAPPLVMTEAEAHESCDIMEKCLLSLSK